VSPDSKRSPRAAERVRVTSPRTAAGRPRRVKVTSEIDAQTALGETYMSSLLRAQLRLAGLVIGTTVVLVGGLPLLFTLFPALNEIHVLKMPLPWAVLGFVVYPYFVVAGWFYLRAAERHERDFTDAVER
jgi:hypothetical protein